jgi:hypothetical protein
MASSSDLTELKSYLISNGLCANCGNTASQNCISLYQQLNSKYPPGSLTPGQLTEMNRLIQSNMMCVICMSSQNPPSMS